MFGEPKQIDINFSDDAVQNMLTLLKMAPFPDKPPIDCDDPWKLGINYSYLKDLKIKFETEWTWKSLANKLAKYNNYLVHYQNDEGDELDLHFVHIKSSRDDAIPLILLHGWPGTFFDFYKVIDNLVSPPGGDIPAFHVVVPSIPGYFLSTLPNRDGWNLLDIAHAYNGLMVEVLGYKRYVGQGGDLGSMILRAMSFLLPENACLSHFNMFITPPQDNTIYSKISEFEKRMLNRTQGFMETGRGYSEIQRTKPFTIGMAIASSPLAVLTYIAEKIYSWSDPELVDSRDILDTVALYYLSGSFLTSVVIYNQRHAESKVGNMQDVFKGQMKTKFAYSAFPYEVIGQLGSTIEKYGPLVYYKEHKRGGHFPALDVPDEFVEDLREFFGEHWGKE